MVVGFSVRTKMHNSVLRRHPERRDEMIQAICRNAERLQRLTNDILDVINESKTLTLNKEKFSLSDLLSNIIVDSAKYESECSKRTRKTTTIWIYCMAIYFNHFLIIHLR